MKRKCTFLMAAFALLAFLAIPMGMRADAGDVHDMNITQSTVLNNNSAIPSINIEAQAYPVEAVTINWRYNKTIENPVTIEVLVDGTSWGTQTITGNTTADAIFEGSATMGPIVINFTNNTGSGTGHGTFYVNSVKLTEGSSGEAPPAPTYTVTFDAGEGTFVGNTDFPDESNTIAAGTYTLPSATRSGYTFDGWMLAGNTEPLTGTYTVSDDVDFTAQYTESTTPPGPGPSGDEVTYDFTQIDGFASWTNSYMSHTVSYSDATVTFASASRQTSTITNQPVTKGGDVLLVMTDGSTLSSVTFVCTQWTTKAQTITLHYSINGGETYTSTGITSSDFTITDNNLPAGTNAVKITFSSNSNQVGIASATIVKVGSTPSTDPSITADDVDIVYDATSGAIEYTINNPVEGGVLTAATTYDSWLILGTVDTTVPFTCAVNEGINARTATVTLTYTYGENNETVTKDVTVTQAGNPNVEAIIVNPTTVYVTAEGEEGNINVTYQNMGDDFAPVIYFYAEDGETSATYDWITVDFDANRNVHYVVEANQGDARMAYFKVVFDGAVYGDEGDPIDKAGRIVYVYSNLVTISQEAYVAPTVATLPFAFDGGRANIETTDGLTQEGLDSDYGSSPKLKFNTTGDWLLLYFNEAPGKLTFDIKGNSFSGGTFKVQTSEDGVTFTDLATYTNLTTAVESEEFDNLGENVRYIRWIYTNKVGGNVALGNITLALPNNAPSIALSDYVVNAPADETEGTLTVTYNNITEVLAEVYFCDASGEAATYEWIEAEIDENNDVYYVIAANDGAARTAYFKVYAISNNNEDVYSDIVTVNQAAYIAPPAGNTYTLYSGELVEDDYVIYYNGVAMKNTVVNNRLSYEEVTPEDDVIVTEDASIVWHIAPSDGGYWTIYNATAQAYAAGTNSKNTAQMLIDGTDALALWTVTGTGTYEFVNYGRSQASSDSNNKYLRRNGTIGFGCYAYSTGGALSLYKNTGGLPYVAAPTFSPAPGSYTEDQEVTISCTTQDAVIYYTTDGSEPTAESDVYAEPISVTEGFTTIKAIAMLDSVSSRVATGVYNINPNIPGSFENPYTVQDAKDNTPSSGYVYVRGIVSEIASSESDVIQYHDISYYISDDGSTANQLFVRYGMNIDSTEFYSLGELQVGDRVVVRGKLEKVGSTPRIAAYNYIVSFERDVEPPFFSPGSCMLTKDENAIVYIFSDTYEAEIHYTMDGTVPTMDSPLFDEGDPINLQDSTGIITIKAIAYYEGMHSAVTTATYRMVEPGTPGTMETPYTVEEILDLMDSIPNIDQVYVRGIVCTNPIIEEGVYHNANYYISDDGTAGEDNQLYVYRGKGLGGEPIMSEDDLRMGDIVTVLGDLQIYNGKKEFKQYSIIYEWERPSSITVSSESFDCGEKDGHLNVGYYNIYFQGNPPTVQLCDEQGNAAEYDWITVTLNGSELNFHVNAAAESDVPRTAYLKVIGGDWSGNEVVSDIASITQNECVFAPLPFHYAYYKLDSESDTDVVARLDSIPDGLTVYGLGDYYSSYPYLKFDAPDSESGQQDYIELAFNEEPARLMFDIQGANNFRGGYFYLQTSTNGLDENWNTIAVYTTAEMIAQMGDDNPLKPISEVLSTDNYETKIFDNLSPEIRYIKWIYATRSVGNVRLGGIHLYTPNDLYDITLNQPEIDSCSISADKAIAVEGETVVLSYEFAEDYYLTGWMVTDENGGSVAVNGNQFIMPASNVTVAAEIGWIERYDIVLNQPEFDGCSIYADKTVAAEGDTVMLSYELAEGYYFIEWNVSDENDGAVAVSNNQFIMPASMVTVEAVIVEATTEYQYAYSINGVETEPQTAIVGESITLDDGANIDAFEFIGWTIDPNDIENVMPAEASYTITEDVTFYAVYSYNVANYVKVNSTEDITNGNYLIVYEEASVAFNGGLTALDGVNNTISVAIEGGVIAANAVTNAATFTIDVDNQTLQSASGYYIGVSSNSNGLKQSEESSAYHNSFAIDGNGDAVISAVFNSSNMVLRFNSASNQNRFRYYGGSQKAIQLYKYVGSDLYTRVFVDNPEGAVAIAGPSIIPNGYVLNVSSITNELGADKLFIEEGGQLVTSNNVNATMRKTINAFQGDANDNYCFISSPVNNQDPAQLGMVNGNYDLYYFDQEATDEEWQNYKVEPFNLTTGNGYLYAKALGGTITFAGMMTNSGAGNTTLNGWYLIGNPYPCNVTINVPYYRLDESGAALVETDSSVAIAPMEGVLVYVEGETIVFTKAPQVSTIGNTGSKVVLKVKP
jgi:uncharacterized repeat protein (TIGR02543 family)